MPSRAKPYDAQWFHSPIALPARKHGRMEVRHRAIKKGEEVIIVSPREALLRGISPVRGFAEKPIRVHSLIESRRGKAVAMWMSDHPSELNQIGELMHTVKPKGRVCIGGLGFGILALTVSRSPAVTDTVVVERSRSVIKLCRDRDEDYAVEHGDIMDYLRDHQEPFDCYLLDTWCPTNEGVWWTEVLPQRRVIRQRWGSKPVVHAWAENIMQGQVRASLMNKTKHWFYSYLPMPLSENAADYFLRNVGLPGWEKRYGAAVDKALEEHG